MGTLFTRRSTLFLLLAAGVTSACAKPKFESYSGPEVTRIEVHKSTRRMYLLHHDQVLRGYDVDLGSPRMVTRPRRAMAARPRGVITSTGGTQTAPSTSRSGSATPIRPIAPKP